MQYKDKNGVIHDFTLIKGESAYDSAVIGGYSGTETEFYEDLGKMATTDDIKSTKAAIDEDVSVLKQDLIHLNGELETVKEKVDQAVANTIDTPFTTAYWKDSINHKLYLVKVENGVLTVMEYVHD